MAMSANLPRRNEAVIRARAEGARRRHELHAPFTLSARILDAAANLADEAGRLDRDDLMRAMGAGTRKERGAIGDAVSVLRRRGRWPYTFWTGTVRLLDAAARLADADGRLRRPDLMHEMGARTKNARAGVDGLIYSLKQQGRWPYTFIRPGGTRDRLAELGRLLDAMTPGERSAAAELVRARSL